MKYLHQLAIGPLAALCSCVWAQGSVALFGVLDSYIQSAKSGPDHLHRLESGGNMASRIGFRGQEHLGAGMGAHFTLEANFASDRGVGLAPGPGLAFTRQAAVGLTGGWGLLELGRMSTSMFKSLAPNDPTRMSSAYSLLNNLLGATDAQPGLRPFTVWISNNVRYRTPGHHSWFVDVSYAFGEVAAPYSSNGRTYSAATGWNGDGWSVAYALQKAKDGSQTMPVAAPQTSHYQGLTGRWDMLPSLRLSTTYLLTHVDAANAPRSRYLQLGATWSINSTAKLLVVVARREVSGSDRGQQGWMLGYDHALSKRTTLYARRLQMDNSANASATLIGMPMLANSGHDLRSIGLGVSHSF